MGPGADAGAADQPPAAAGQVAAEELSSGKAPCSQQVNKMLHPVMFKGKRPVDQIFQHQKLLNQEILT